MNSIITSPELDEGEKQEENESKEKEIQKQKMPKSHFKYELEIKFITPLSHWKNWVIF